MSAICAAATKPGSTSSAACPFALEIGPRDVAGDTVFMARRDKPPSEKAGMPRGEFVANIGKTLAEIQTNLFQRALTYREANTRKIDKLDEFKAWFTPKNAEQPEIHGGFALCHVNESPEVGKDSRRSESQHPLPAGGRRIGRLRRTRQMHFHRPAQFPPRSAGESVLISLSWLQMGSPAEPSPVLLILAAFSRHPEALAWAQANN